jgi:CHAT domain-containing protein
VTSNIDYLGTRAEKPRQTKKRHPKKSTYVYDPLYNLIEHIHPSFEKVLKRVSLEALCAAPTFMAWRLGVSDRFLYEALLPRIKEKLPSWRVLVPIRRSVSLRNLGMAETMSLKDLNTSSVLQEKPDAEKFFAPEDFLTFYNAVNQTDASKIISNLLSQAENYPTTSEHIIILIELFEPIETEFIKQLRHLMRYGTPLSIIPWLHAEIATTPHELLDQFRNHIVMLPSPSELGMLNGTNPYGIKLDSNEKFNLALLSGPCVGTVREWRTEPLLELESLDTNFTGPTTVPKPLIDFEIKFSFNEIHVRSLDRQCRPVSFPFSNIDKIEARYSALNESKSNKTIQRFGELLFDTLIREDIKYLWHRIQENASNSNQGIRLRLVCTEPRLIRVPWEYIYDKQEHRFIALAKDYSIVRAFADLNPSSPLHVGDQLRLLAVSSSPPQLTPVRAEDEKRRIKEILKKSPHINQFNSLQGNQKKLRDQLGKLNPHVLHYVGHGYFNNATAEALLAFEGENDETNYINVDSFDHLLQAAESIRLVVLNACSTAEVSTARVISGFAQSLAQKNIPAIVAMQDTICDEASFEFAQGFYQALSKTGSVERGMVAGRQSIQDDAKSNEWGLPVLWLRAPEGKLFDIPNMQGA